MVPKSQKEKEDSLPESEREAHAKSVRNENEIPLQLESKKIVGS